jgi:hypothetical protein
MATTGHQEDEDSASDEWRRVQEIEQRIADPP